MVISCKGQPLWFELTSMEIFSFQSSLIVISSPNFFLRYMAFGSFFEGMYDRLDHNQ